MMRRSVDLPQPDGPISETNSRGRDLEVDLLQRADAAAREVLRQTTLSETTAAGSFIRRAPGRAGRRASR